MASITTDSLVKNFVSYRKKPGFWGSVVSLFSREYETKTAVDHFDLEIPPGQIVGLLGPNGAGKTTLMKMLTGIVVPTSGNLSVAGHDPSQREKTFRKKIALVMGQKSQLWWDIPAMDSFHLLQKYYEIPKKDFDERIEEMTELLNVKDLLHVHVRKLSLGERMKMELMASLLHSPEVIFLDEPTIGLDLMAQENIREFIKNYHKRSQPTIILTSHYMADVQELCSRLVLIAEGKKGFDGPLHKFERILGHEKSMHFTFESPLTEGHDFFSPYSPEWKHDGQTVEVRVKEEDLKDFSTRVLNQFPVKDFGTEKMPIEKVMKKLMQNPQILNTTQSGEH